MGDLEVDTRVSGADGRYTADLSPAWEIWGPCGGYIAAVLLRAAGAHSGLPRPVSLAVHFLGVARFAPIDLHVETLQAGRRSHCVRVAMTQEGRPISHAVVWTTVGPAGPAGIEYDWATRPDRPGPEGLPTIEELAAENRSTFAFWDNIECRPFGWLDEHAWANDRPLPPTLTNWYRFRPTPVFEDPFVEAARVAMLCDLMGWPSVVRALEPGLEEAWMAPNLDVTVTFHQAPEGSPFLLLDAESPVAAGGTIGSCGRVWSEDGRLLATSIQQMLARPVPRPS
jgi:acyl-CoA thioesterase II